MTVPPATARIGMVTNKIKQCSVKVYVVVPSTTVSACAAAAATTDAATRPTAVGARTLTIIAVDFHLVIASASLLSAFQSR